MPNYDNNLSGALFRNDKKTSDKHPDYKGECEINGEKLYISAWINESKKGTKYMKLAFEYPQGAGPTQQRAAAPVESSDFQRGNGGGGGQAAFSEDDIPFAWDGFELFPHDAGRSTSRV